MYRLHPFIRRMFALVLLLYSSGLTVAVQANEVEAVDPASLFDAAHSAYAEGRYENADQLYQQLIDHGFAQTEVWYNRGNVAFHQGNLGDAMLYYRRAWYLSPRDADIQANVNLARQRAGAIIPPTGVLDRAAQELSHAEWRTLMMWSYWISVLAITGACFLPAARRFLKPCAIASGAVALVAIGGWAYWQHWTKKPEVVVVQSGQTALYEPRENATPFFTVPEGSIIQLEDSFDAWIKIRADQKSGWLTKSSVKQVYSWNSANLE